MDAFFASVEQLDHPELRGRPIVVGGGGRRGVIAAASYEARAFGVRSAMPGFKAKELCPDLIFVKQRFDRYKEISRQIRDIFSEYSDLIEPLSLDEAFLDVTENKKNNPSASMIAKEIRQEILDKTGLTASAGISINKFIAKVASDINKPDGQKLIPPEEVIPFLEKLHIEKFFGIGKVAAKKMHRLGITTGKDLKQHSKLQLAQWFGKSGIHFYHIVRGEDNRPVKPYRIRKSIGAERTFTMDISSLEDIKSNLEYIAERVVNSMVKLNRYGKTVTLKVKFSDFSVITRSRTLDYEVKDLAELINISNQLAIEHLSNTAPIRLLGISITKLTPLQSSRQLEFLFPSPSCEE